MSYIERAVDLTFELGEGQFGDDGSNTVKVSGLRTQVAIEVAGGTAMGTAVVQIYGLTQNIMNTLMTLGQRPIDVRNNRLTIEVGNVGGQMSAVFVGTIADAYMDFNNQPEVSFNVTAFAGLIEALRPVAPTSYQGGVDVATVLAGLATLANLSFENSGVQGIVLSNPYFPGTARQQIEACAQAAGIEWVIELGKLAIWPKGGSRGGLIPLISEDTGLVGYPMFNSMGITARTEFNPSIGFGSSVEVRCNIPPACGNWIVSRILYELESQVPGGAWFTIFDGRRLGFGIAG